MFETPNTQNDAFDIDSMTTLSAVRSLPFQLEKHMSMLVPFGLQVGRCRSMNYIAFPNMAVETTPVTVGANSRFQIEGFANHRWGGERTKIKIALGIFFFQFEWLQKIASMKKSWKCNLSSKSIKII